MNVNDSDLIFNNGTKHVWKALDKIPRTGWVQWGIPNPETVAEHTISARKLAHEWKGEFGLSDEDFF